MGWEILMDHEETRKILDKGAHIRQSKDVEELKWVFVSARENRIITDGIPTEEGEYHFGVIRIPA